MRFAQEKQYRRQHFNNRKRVSFFSEMDPEPWRDPQEPTTLSTPAMATVNDNNVGASDDKHLATHDTLIATEELQEASMVNEANDPQENSYQLSSIPTVAPMMNNFEEIPSKASTPLEARSEPGAGMPQVVDEHRDAAVELLSVQPAIESVPLKDISEHVSLEMATTPPTVESSSSTEYSEIIAPRARRNIRRKISFTERLEPFESDVSKPRARRYFDIFSFSYRTIWNKTIEVVQSGLADRLKQQRLHQEAPISRETSDQRIDSGFQQTSANMTVASTLLLDHNDVAEEDFIMSSDQLATIASTDGKLMEVTDRLEPCSEATSELQDSAQNVVVPIFTTRKESNKQEKIIKRNREKKPKDGNDPSSELSKISEQIEDSQEIAPLDAMMVHVMIAVQGEMCRNRKRIGSWISMQRLQELLRVNTRLGASKLFKNVMLLKQADMLDIKLSAQHHITDVSVKLPQIDAADVP
ncbi:uncharacterized protein LOC118511623 isoform X2 [Anopheles stephensi]|uniref:uncharacterized protein LOC118511623 isoform X2 n=1 Tax=Anopheles stephensi TaxID=30069 RepID=UPI0016589398|nr:uncharacterized protein LOC118511623 isoform X2 [Anopheles stephensi]